MARARLRIVTVRDEDVLNNEPPDSKAMPVASPAAQAARKAAPKAPSAKSTAPKPKPPKASVAKTPRAGIAQSKPAQAKVVSAESVLASDGKAETAAKRAAAAPKPAAPKPVLVTTLMRTDVVTCSAAESLSTVGQLMWDNNVGAVVVVDEASRPLAVVTDRDLAMAAYTQGIALGHIGVGICMSKRLLTCSGNADATSVAGLMREHQIRRVPVVDAQGQLVGIVGLSDLLNAKATSKSVDLLGVLAGILS